MMYDGRFERALDDAFREYEWKPALWLPSLAAKSKFLRSLRESGYVVVPQKALDAALSRGCDHCAQSLAEARTALAPTEGEKE